MCDSVVLLDEAEEDIFRNACWWAENHSLVEALDWESSVRRQLRQIKDGPASRSLSPENYLVPIEIRDALVGTPNRRTYRGIFTIKGKTVYVLRVFSAAEGEFRSQDIPIP